MLKIDNTKDTIMGLFPNENLRILAMEPVIENNEKFLNESSENEVLQEQVEVQCNKSEKDDSENFGKNNFNEETTSETKIQLSFSVDRLLRSESSESFNNKVLVHCDLKKCCEQKNFPFCTHPGCLFPNLSNVIQPTLLHRNSLLIDSEANTKTVHGSSLQAPPNAFLDYASKCIVRPFPIRALNGNSCENDAYSIPSFSTTLATTSLLQRLHQQQQQQKQAFPHPHHNTSLSFTPMGSTANSTLSPVLITPLACNFKSLELNSYTAATSYHQPPQQQKQQHFRPAPISPSHFPKLKVPTTHFDISTTNNAHYYHPTHAATHSVHHQLHQQLPLTHQQQHQTMLLHSQLGNNNSSIVTNENNNNSNGVGNGSHTNNNHNNNGKRKRSWSRAVFSNLQRKGLEIQFQQQKYITKPDRRKLAARLNLTDAQVKVWFQNRRMKWRHTRENLKSGHEKQPKIIESAQRGNQKFQPSDDLHHEMEYSSDGSDSSMVISENDDDGEIDVVE